MKILIAFIISLLLDIIFIGVSVNNQLIYCFFTNNTLTGDEQFIYDHNIALFIICWLPFICVSVYELIVFLLNNIDFE